MFCDRNYNLGVNWFHFQFSIFFLDFIVFWFGIFLQSIIKYIVRFSCFCLWSCHSIGSNTFSFYEFIFSTNYNSVIRQWSSVIEFFVLCTCKCYFTLCNTYLCFYCRSHISIINNTNLYYSSSAIFIFRKIGKIVIEISPLTVSDLILNHISLNTRRCNSDGMLLAIVLASVILYRKRLSVIINFKD